MPFTPYHLGPGLLFGLLLLNFINFPTFLIASVIVDIEPLIIILFNLNPSLHGFFHSFLGGTLVAFLLAALMSVIRKYLSPILEFFKIERKSSFKKILLGSLFGVYTHILLDSFLYIDIRPFLPLSFNPFLIIELPSLSIYLFCVFCFVGAIFIYIIRLYLIYSHKIPSVDSNGV